MLISWGGPVHKLSLVGTSTSSASHSPFIIGWQAGQGQAGWLRGPCGLRRSWTGFMSAANWDVPRAAFRRVGCELMPGAVSAALHARLTRRLHAFLDSDRPLSVRPASKKECFRGSRARDGLFTSSAIEPGSSLVMHSIVMLPFTATPARPHARVSHSEKARRRADVWPHPAAHSAESESYKLLLSAELSPSRSTVAWDRNAPSHLSTTAWCSAP